MSLIAGRVSFAIKMDLAQLWDIGDKNMTDEERDHVKLFEDNPFEAVVYVTVIAIAAILGTVGNVFVIGAVHINKVSMLLKCVWLGHMKCKKSGKG